LNYKRKGWQAPFYRLYEFIRAGVRPGRRDEFAPDCDGSSLSMILFCSQ